MNTDSMKALIGYCASLTFGGVSLLSAIHYATGLVGLMGAIMGTIGAYYTFRIQRRRWLHPQKGN